MHSAMISRLAVLFMALLLLVSCSLGGGKKEAGKVKPAGTAAKSAPKQANAGSAAQKPAPQKATSLKGASSPQDKKDVDYNGITQFSEK